LVPKTEELVATPYRFENNKEKAKEFFEKGLHQAFERMREKQHPDYPLTIYYAFKQAENESEGGEMDMEDEESEEESTKKGKKTKGTTVTASTGWETMLAGLIRSEE